MKRQQRTIGAIVKIKLDDKYHTYARILGEASFAFYDIRTTQEIEPKEIVTKPILFIAAVYNDAITHGRWEKVGKLPLEDELKVLPPKFIQDALDASKFEIYDNGVIRPALKSECVGLERSAVWEPEAIEERIRNHYDDVPNVYIELDKNIFSS